MEREHRIDIAGHDGQRLAAVLHLPLGPRRATALFAHCFTCGKDLPAARRIAGRLVAAGIAVMRFDFTGLGDSEGGALRGFAGEIEDILAAAHHLAADGMGPELLIGHSLGGSAVLAAAADIPAVRAVVTIGAPFDPTHALAHAEGEGGHVTIAGRRYPVSPRFFTDFAGHDPGARIAALSRAGKALLVMHDPVDEVVAIDNASRIFLAARHPKSFISLEGAGHLLPRARDAEYVAGVIAAWADRYLPEIAASAEPAEGVVRVSEADPDGFLQDIRAGRHALLADEPVAAGGTDLGPSPYQLLAAALGACTTMTIRMYVRRKGWPLEHVEVDVSHEKVHAADCTDCRPSDRIDLFHRRIRLEGPLEPAQKARIIEIADRCPVHRTLTRSAKIETVLSEDEA